MRYQPPFPAVIPHPGVDAHALLARAPVSTSPKRSFCFDCHVLGLPPAFVLSQDQTLRLTSPNAPAKTTGTPGSSTGSSQVKTRAIPPIQAPKTPAKAKSRKPNRQAPSNTRQTKRHQCQHTRTSPTKDKPAARLSHPTQHCQTP